MVINVTACVLGLIVNELILTQTSSIKISRIPFLRILI